MADTRLRTGLKTRSEPIHHVFPAKERLRSLHVWIISTTEIIQSEPVWKICNNAFLRPHEARETADLPACVNRTLRLPGRRSRQATGPYERASSSVSQVITPHGALSERLRARPWLSAQGQECPARTSTTCPNGTLLTETMPRRHQGARWQTKLLIGLGGKNGRAERI